MIAIKAALMLLMLASCSPHTGDGVRTPENWTLDKSSMYRDLNDGLLSKYEKHVFEVLQAESLDANADGIEEGVIEAADNIEAIVDIIKSYHENIAINKTLWKANLDYEDATCFMRRGLERLEVHLHARIGFQRKLKEAPEVALNLNFPIDKEDKQRAKIIDGGATVYVYEFDEPRVISIKNISQITLEKKSKSTYHKVKYKFGQGYCTKRLVWGTGWCTKEEAQKDTYYHEGDTVFVDGIDIYAKYPGDARKYKVYSSLPTNNHQPMAILSGVTPIYSVPSFRNNPHWVMHYLSSKCNGWGQADHDNSDFGREIWDKYASKGKPIGSNVLRKKFSCKDQTLMDIGIAPPDIIETYDESSSTTPDNIWFDGQLEVEPATEHACQPNDVEEIMEQARKEADTIVLPEEKIKFDASADWDPEVLQEKRDDLEGQLDSLRNSNTGLQSDYNDHYRIGCFYDRELLDGIFIKITGQVLVSIGGRLFSVAQAKKKFGSDAIPDLKQMPQLSIGFGYSEKLAYLETIEAEADDNGWFVHEKMAKPGFTKNFTLRDLTYVHLARNFSDKFFQLIENEEVFRNDFWGHGEHDMPTNSLKVERKILAITSIELSVGGKEDDPSNLKQPLYSLKSVDLNESNQPKDPEYDDYGVMPSLFILSNASSSWTDFGLKGNAKWEEYRNENNLCDSK